MCAIEIFFGQTNIFFVNLGSSSAIRIVSHLSLLDQATYFLLVLLFQLFVLVFDRSKIDVA